MERDENEPWTHRRSVDVVIVFVSLFSSKLNFENSLQQS